MQTAQIKTAGDLRGFLADIMVGIREGSVEPQQAHAISKIAAQINQSLAVEINTALQLERMGKDRTVAGSMLIGRAEADTSSARLLPTDEDGMIWCDQCDMRVTCEQASGCKSKHCKARAL